MDQMAFSDLLIQLHSLCAKHCGRPWVLTELGCGACPGGTFSLGEGKWMNQQITYNQAWSEF